MFNENFSKNDALPRAVCVSCKYQIEKAWQQSRKAEEQSIQYLSLLKRKRAQSPLSSSGDEQTVTRIECKKVTDLLLRSTVLNKCRYQQIHIQQKNVHIFYQSYSPHLQQWLMHESVKRHQPYVKPEK